MTAKKTRWVGTILVFIGIVLFTAWLEYLTPLFADDFSYSVSFVIKQPMHSLSDVLISQKLHYTVTNGRAVVHTLAQLLLWLGKPGVDLVFGLLMGTFCLLICAYWRGSIRTVEPWQLAAVFAFLWFFTPSFGGSYLWKMGAANYLLSPQLVLLYFFPYRVWCSRTWEKGRRIGAFCGVLMLLLGVLAGWTNENTCLALIAMIAVTLFLRRLRGMRGPVWMLSGLAGVILGALLLFLSPAQANRLQASGGMGGLSVWFQRFRAITDTALEHLWILVGIWAACVVLLLVRHFIRKTGKGRTDLAPVWVTLAGFLIALYSMVGSPEFPVWAWSSILAFALIFTGVLLCTAAGTEGAIPAVGQIVIVAAAALAILVSYHFVSPELHRVHAEFSAREATIRQAVADGEREVAVPGIAAASTYSSYSLFPDLGADCTQWPNTAIANYYGLDSVSLEGESPFHAD